MRPPSARRRPRRSWWLPLLAGVLAGLLVFAGLRLLGDGGDVDGERSPAPASAPERDAIATGRAVFVSSGCASCHSLDAAGASGSIGPDLDSRLDAHTRESLRAKILDPYAGPPQEFAVMPEDYARRLGRADLEALLDFLTAARPSG